MKEERLIIYFIGIFVIVYFVEAIAGFYITTNIVNIERQFQIPSKISGTMVSASDFGYIPSVIFVSYLGSKGNRAKWIGGGCMLIGLANLMIAYSHFLFPSENINLTSTAIETGMERDLRRLKYDTINLSDFITHFSNQSIPGTDFKSLNIETKDTFIGALNNTKDLNKQFFINGLFNEKKFDGNMHFKDENVNNSLILKTLVSSLSYCNDVNDKENLNCNLLFKFLKKYNSPTPEQLSDFRQLIHSSYAFCDATVNKLRQTTKQIKCDQNFSAIGPTVLIFSGLFILGIGRTVPFSLGLPLMDDNVKKKNLPVYFAIMFLIRVLGPSLAFTLGSKLNQYYYLSEVPPGMGVRDPMWIGRWWLGFVIIGIALLVPSIIMFFFPHSEDKEEDGNEVELKRLNGEEEPKAVKEKPKLHLFDKHLNKKDQTPMSFNEKISDFKQAILECFKRPVFISATFGRCIDVFAFKGFFIFMNKYLEIQYDIPQYLTNRYIGSIFVIGFATGAILGSVVMKVGKLEGRKAAAWVGICSAIAASMTFMNTMTGCESVITKLSEAGSLNNFNFTNNCINSCVCDDVPLYPVCDEFGKPFYSPCHAGCKPYYNSSGYLEISRNEDENGSDIVFNDCTCTLSESTKVSRDFCKNDDCNRNLKYYFFNMGVGGFFAGLSVVPAVLICLRSVPSQHRSIALGFQGFVVSLFATLPSSPAWGTLIDKFCRMWNVTCDGRGSCIFFDTHGLRVYLHAVYGSIRVFSLISDILVFIYAKDLKLSAGLDDPEKEEEENTEVVLAATTNEI
uniref:Solute carrier organic anion transporter family member n=1 Tax=Strongyloides papillosus TaxID=174720 RepID=A0A0N5BRL5_STREA